MGQAPATPSKLNTTTASTTVLVLTKDSARKHRVVGTVPQTIVLPPVTDLDEGDEYIFFNSSTGVLTINNTATPPVAIATVFTTNSKRLTLVDKTSGGTWLSG